MTTEPTHCECGESLAGYYCQTFSAEGKVVRTICYYCDKRERWEDWRKTGRLTARLLMDAALDENRGGVRTKANEASERLEEKARLFKQIVWFGGLQEMVRAKNGHSWEGPPKLLALASAGRALVTLDSPEASVTLICAEDDSGASMGVQGIDATLEQALALMLDAMALWAKGKRPTADREVSFGF